MKRKRLRNNQEWILLALVFILILLAMCCVIYQLPRPMKIAVSYDKKLEFLDSYGKSISSLSCNFNNLDILAHDSKRNKIYFTQIQDNDTTIFRLDTDIPKTCSFHSLTTIKTKRLSGMAFDSITNILYFIEKNDNSIFYLHPEKNIPITLLKFEKEEVHDIAIDTCLQYIFWTNNNIDLPTIERANLDGTNRRVIINSSLSQPMGITVDEIEEKIYWIDDRPGFTYSISRSNFDGTERQLLLKDTHQRPHTITINQDFIFWTDIQSHSIWKLNKNGIGEKQLITHSSIMDIPNSLIAWSDQRLRLGTTCRKHLMPIFADAAPSPNSAILHCDNGGYWNGSNCICPPEYKGLQCEFNLCTDFCMFNGKCNIAKDGSPWCQCKPGYVGTRCERDQCSGLCLNGGQCILLPASSGAQCDCPEGFKGNRCEININFQEKIEKICRNACKLPQFHSSQILAHECNCSLHEDISEWFPSNASQPLVVSPIYDKNFLSSKFVTLGMSTIIVFSFFVILLLAWRIRVLSRRPRIKKRIIVNKNVTPMANRDHLPHLGLPSTDQCEITIENCCNMNICETPCFEPQFRTPDKSSETSGKEEKKGLLGHMEEPDLTRPILHHKRHDDLF